MPAGKEWGSPVLLRMLVLLPAVLYLAGCGERTSNPDDAVPPGIFSIEPDSGVFDTRVTVTGEHFDPDPERNLVRFNDSPARVLEASTGRLLVEVPRRAGTGPLEVTVDGLTARGPQFRYLLTITVETWAGRFIGFKNDR